MKFDVAIIGGGLAGLSCGIRLAEQGKRCAIISAGQSALHFSSGSLDFLSQRTDGSTIEKPLDALAELGADHPYVRLGGEAVSRMAKQAEAMLADCGLHFFGSIEQNHRRVTPLGTLRATWLSPKEVPVAPIGGELPWRRVAVVGIEGFLDFQPQLAAASLAERGVEATIEYLHLPALDGLRKNPSEFRATNISRVLDLPENLALLAQEVARLAEDVDAVILPACVGLEDSNAIETLREHAGKPVMLVPTLPPSLLGIRLHQALRRRFLQLGGQFMPGDTVLKAELEGQRVARIYTRNHTDIPIEAQQVVLASGSFFSNGLIAEFERIFEPVFGLDVLDVPERPQWTHQNMFVPQPYLRFGVKADETLRGTVNGQSLDNLYVIGAVLGGYDPLQQGCGAGVSLVTALYAAERILTQAEVAQ
ncbi:anaerobic glycerol-3-phosphate dehydrogenase subunit B [Leminorella grimontii]|uniref:Anaerobic glycerol-3-phosphate dehydrogenase subunit B n=1 Tax=Leminorella grimontii TaxID=82981 RepID=A0AAV5N492_9GAMM|nr:glycerol-3-phosphate dehydrogenase subunit GlpB [Leminorella grimontii]KFC93726.1 anaerobic glycerol-3-phosphate dehydrogenase subunit B [Leminorella grimontii ATCC 33999 = DSM 5078]GKX55576.1 anaerobic glycerol-3-phosphate dehydrogenase subunit B [Leminorella grimontii]VFS55590.1 Anaerobic glycerol-3-phosphate dehydrogenase subunit B [Leminorella grimontii]